MFSKYELFFLIKLILVLIHLKYWYYNTPSLELSCLPVIFVKFHSGQLKPFFNAIINMFFFIGFPILSYSMQPHATNIGYTKPYAKQNQPSLLSSCIQIIMPDCSNTLPISRAISLSKLGNTVNNNSIFNTKSVEFSTKW